MQNKEIKKTELAPKQKSYTPYVIVATVLVAILVTSGFLLSRTYNTINHVTATIGSEQFTLEVANTDVAREQGLSERDELGTNSGMLFDFGELGDWRMHMIQMRFPIDIAWLDQYKKIVHIKHNATPAEYPEVYKAEQLTKFVVEVPSGTFDRLDVQEGDSISF